MCKPVLLSSEYRKWAEKPFISGSVTPETRTGGRFEGLLCMHCGSVVICGGTKLHNATARGRRFFCDIECANEYKKWHNRTEEYKATIGWHEIRQKRAEEEGKKRLNSWVCCSWCGVAFQRTSDRNVCCGRTECRRIQNAAKQRSIRGLANGSLTCGHCGIEFFTNRHLNLKRYCSKRCATRAGKQHRKHSIRSAAFNERIGLITVAKQSKWRCTNCRVKCVRPTGSNEPNEITLDHIVPLSKGGWHTRSNVQLLCRLCNSRKSDSVKPGTQLMLLTTGNSAKSRTIDESENR